MRKKILFSTILNGLVSVGPQFFGLFFLKSAEFGLFSAIYLIFALAIAIVLSVLCDPWVILSEKGRTPGGIYASNLLILSLSFAMLAALVSVILNADLLIILLGALCVMMGTYRSGARYYQVQSARWNTVISADLVSLFVLVTFAILSVQINEKPLLLVMLAWLTSSICACLFGPHFVGFKFEGLIWMKRNWSTIRPLLVDSIAMEVSSVGTPYLLLPVLGLNGFGIYRAISNLSSPIRLLVSPLRPMIVASPILITGKKITVLVLLVSVGIALIAISLFEIIVKFNITMGVLSEVAVFSLPAGIYLIGAVLISLFPLVVRSLQNSKALMIGRITQTVAGVLLPVMGFFVFGLGGAMWAYGISSLISGILWMVLAMIYRDSKPTLS